MNNLNTVTRELITVGKLIEGMAENAYGGSTGPIGSTEISLGSIYVKNAAFFKESGGIRLDLVSDMPLTDEDEAALRAYLSAALGVTASTRITGVPGTGVVDTGVRDTGVGDTVTRDPGIRGTVTRDPGTRGTGTRGSVAHRANARGTGARDRVKAGDFASSMKKIDIADGAYFEKNPKIICGVPVTHKPVPIADITSDTRDRVTVAGEVVMLDYRAIKDGEVEIMQAGISDGSGSIVVKQFINKEYLKYVKPRLVKGINLIVYGEPQYDKYQKETVIFAVDIGVKKKEQRRDTAQVKRVELHMHSNMSAMDAVTPVGELVSLAAEFGHPAVAITDHGVVQAFPAACAAGAKHKIKIIYGVEAYLDASRDGKHEESGRRAYHIIILAKNKVGLKNLYKLISKSHIDYFYRRPLMPRAEIEAHREGLIVGSACEAGELYQTVLSGASRDEQLRVAGFYDYLEIQPNGNNLFMIRNNKLSSVDDLCRINEQIVSLGEELNKPVAATCDVHFANASDEIFRRILMAGQNYQDADDQPPLFFRTTDEMLEEFAYLGPERARRVVVDNPNIIADWTDPKLRPIPDGTYNPVIDGADGELRALTREKMKSLYGDPPPRIVSERLEQELLTLESKSFSVLYMIAHKLVKKSNDDGYVVGSRGSVGSSLAATLADITEVNPLPPHYLCHNCKYSEFITDGSVISGFDLPRKPCPRCDAPSMIRDGQDIMFEIFIGAKGSEKAPDIDLNFSGEYQATAHKYTEELFGADNVFKAGTIGTIAKKTAYGFVKKYLEGKNMSPGRVEEERLSDGCTGVKRTTGQHPGGIIVIPHDKEIYDFTPVQRPADATGSDIITTHFDFHALHDTILKLDILGHDDPSVIKMLEDLTGVGFSSIEPNDSAIMSLFNGTEALGVSPEEIGSPVGTIGLPEFGTRFIRQMLVETKPKNFSDLLQISGLSHGTNVWINNAQELIKAGTCTVSEVIGTRESIVFFLMSRGLDQLTSFRIMESVRKGKGVSEENEIEMSEKGVPRWYIDSCKKIEYLFPKAHATAYVQMAYRQAWYKISAPQAFYATYFSIRADDFDAALMTRGCEKAKMKLTELNALGRDISPREQKIQTILEVVVEMYARGISFLPVDLYLSDESRFLIEDGNLRPPLSSLAGLGMSAAQGICSARGGGVFISVEDLAARSKISKAVVEILRDYGALDGMAAESQLSLFDF